MVSISKRKLQKGSFWLYPIVDRANWISRLAETRLNIIQLRIKDLEGKALEREIEEAVYLSKKNNIRLFVNDYWTIKSLPLALAIATPTLTILRAPFSSPVTVSLYQILIK